tara:strand:- start:5242 stop:6162 length:921 start_codon:yes stop_codon:yes gene_type:complete
VIDCAFVFPGQGSQYLGMCKDDFFSEYPYKTFFEIASKKFDIDILNICRNGPTEKLNSTYIAQPAILIHSLIIDKILKKNGIKSKAVAGHSLGEYTALVSSGVLSFEECLDILIVRCREMEKANNKYMGAMLAVINEDIESIEKVCNQFDNTVIANINSQNQIIISGPNSEIEKSIEILKSYSIKKLIKLNVAGAFHSPLMDIANVSLNKVINSVNFKDANCAIYQNVSAKDLIFGSEIKENLMKQLTGTVNWYKTIKNMEKNNIDTIIELGPKKVLSKLAKKINSNFKILSIDNLSDLQLHGFKI